MLHQPTSQIAAAVYVRLMFTNLRLVHDRAQGAMYQLTEVEVMEVETKLGPDPTEEDRTAAYKRARNRSSIRSLASNLMEQWTWLTSCT